MNQKTPNHVFLSYSEQNRDFVESLARRLHGDARLSFWFAPWHSIPGVPMQSQIEDALQAAQACAVFVSASDQIDGWQNEQMRAAIQARVEDDPSYRIIPVLLPGVTRIQKRALPRFLRLYEAVEFHSPTDEQAFQYLLAGILGMPPIQVAGFLQTAASQIRMTPAPTGQFTHGHALVIGVANYLHTNIRSLPSPVLNDAHDLATLLTDPAHCGYPAPQVRLLVDAAAHHAGLRSAFADLAVRAQPDDTVIIFFSGHGEYAVNGNDTHHYLLPYDCDLADLANTAIAGADITTWLRNIRARRLLVLFNACHSGGAGEPLGPARRLSPGLSEDYYAQLAQGKGRVVIASSRADEFSWVLHNMRNSLFTHYLLEALRGQTRTLDDGYVRVFDLFRHVADQVPARAAQSFLSQHPIFKANRMEQDFPVALARTRIE